MGESEPPFSFLLHVERCYSCVLVGHFFLLVSHCAVKTICQKCKSLLELCVCRSICFLSLCILSNTDVLRHSSPPALSQKHLNCMLCERGRDTQAKVKRPKRRIHVSPDEIGNYTLHMQGPELLRVGPFPPTTGREMLKSHFFFFSPEVKELLVFAQHTNTQCV